MARKIPIKITRRKVQIILGLLWILDGALQLQNQMFTSNFTNNVILPAAQGQPFFVHGPVNFAAHIVLKNPILFDSIFAFVQLCLGVFILWRRSAKYALLASIAWAFLVWYFGESLGGLASGHTLLLIGAPGAALLYAIIGIGVFPRRHVSNNRFNRPEYWLAFVWLVVWLGGATLQLVNGQNTSHDLSSMIVSNSPGMPGWLASFNASVSSLINSFSGWFVGLVIIIESAIGVLIFAGNRAVRVAAVFAGIAVSALFWVVGQDMGGFFTGLATDPNTGPLIILLGIAVLAAGYEAGDQIEAIV